jgi:hypothetical protein
MFKKTKKSSSVPEKLTPLLPVNELFIISWATYKEKIKTLVYITLFGFLPSLLLAVLLSVTVVIFIKTANSIAINNVLAIFFVGLFIYFALRIHIAIHLIVGKNITSVKNAWQSAGKYFWNYSLTLFWAGLLIMLLMVLFFIPGFIFLVFYSMVLWVFFMENYHGYTAIKRSKELVTGYWISVTLRLLSLLVPLLVLSTLTSVIKNLAVQDFISSIVDFFFGLFVVIYTYHLYKNLREIKGPSKLQQQKYQPWVYVAIMMTSIIIFMALYLAVVFGPMGAHLAA